jgi:hypothetical protein
VSETLVSISLPNNSLYVSKDGFSTYTEFPYRSFSPYYAWMFTAACSTESCSIVGLLCNQTWPNWNQCLELAIVLLPFNATSYQNPIMLNLFNSLVYCSQDAALYFVNGTNVVKLENSSTTVTASAVDGLAGTSTFACGRSAGELLWVTTDQVLMVSQMEGKEPKAMFKFDKPFLAAGLASS